MNHFHEAKLVYWGLPRTGSRYVFGRLKEAYSTDYEVPNHRVGVHPDCEHYEVICSIRNPYRRALSTWKWMNLVGDDKFFPNSFPDFVHSVAPGWASPITTVLGSLVDRVDHFVRLEHCEMDLKKISSFPKDLSFPGNSFQSSYCSPPKEYYADRGVEDKIWEIYRMDFETFGYTRDS